jgi:hypothetical protein
MKVISCFFGRNAKILPAPIADSIFFTNNRKLGYRAEDKGWSCEYVDWPILRKGGSSLQAKWIKYLQFSRNDDEYLYCDHNIPLTSMVIEQIRGLAVKNILVIQHRTPNRTLAKEFVRGCRQPRYRKARMQEYLKLRRKQGFDFHSPVVMTGLIHYKISPEVVKFARSVLVDCLRMRNPHCQVFWALHAQRHPHLIETIEHGTLGRISWL